MRNLILLIVPFVLLQINLSAQIITEQTNEPIFFNVKSHDPTIKELPAKSFYESKADWQYIIDTTWGTGLPLEQKQQIFNAYVVKLEEKFDGFESLGFTTATWDTFKTHYYSKIDTSTSRGKFSAIMYYFAMNLHDGHTYAYDDVVVHTSLNPGVPLLVFGSFFSIKHFGAVTTVLEDSTALVLRVVDNHPLNLEPGDIILGYEGELWKNIVQELIEAELPAFGGRQEWWFGGTTGSPSSSNNAIHISVGMNWHLFETIDIYKHSTGDTLHLSVTPLLNLNISDMLNNEQLEIPTIPFPGYWNQELVTYGIIPNSNIGYIYVFAEWPTGLAEQQFFDAIDALQNTDGLIIDMRWNEGGWALWQDAFAILCNDVRYTIDDLLRCSPSNWLLCPTNDTVTYKIGGIPTEQFERPIAVLLGPACFSMGDLNAYRLSDIPTVKTFGRATAANLGYNEGITNFNDWIIRYSIGDMYQVKEPNAYLNKKEFPIDYSIWFNPTDVANGDDTVVEAALEWINNLVYGHYVITDKGYATPGTDSIKVSAIVENPNSNNVSAQIFIKDLNNTVIDSLDLTETESGNIWEGTWSVPNYEDIFKLDIKATDQTTGESFTIENVNRFSTAGPVVIDSLIITYNPFPRTYTVKAAITNKGQSATVEGLYIAMSTEDSSVTYINGSLSIASLAPGETVFPSSSFTVRVDTSIFSGEFLFNFNIKSDGWSYWKDTVSYIVTGVEDEMTLPEEFSLSQNYPNPFNPSTTIKYGVKERSFVELRVYDILGREVVSLINEEKDAGYYENNFNASKLSSGVYFYQLKAGTFVETKKMLLLK